MLPQKISYSGSLNDKYRIRFSWVFTHDDSCVSRITLKPQSSASVRLEFNKTEDDVFEIFLRPSERIQPAAR